MRDSDCGKQVTLSFQGRRAIATVQDTVRESFTLAALVLAELHFSTQVHGMPSRRP